MHSPREALLQQFLESPSEAGLQILADALEDEADPCSEWLRSDQVMAKKFINWWGKHLFVRASGEEPRQLGLWEGWLIMSAWPDFKKDILEGRKNQNGISGPLAKGFFEWVTHVVRGEKAY